MTIRPGIAVVLAGLTALATAAGAAQLTALATVQPGQWQLHEIDGEGVSSICIADPRALLQIRHATAQCSRYVMDSDARSATIHYTCPGAGHGRTTITVRTPNALKIETQGIADGAPFALEYNARRVGACSGAARLASH